GPRPASMARSEPLGVRADGGAPSTAAGLARDRRASVTCELLGLFWLLRGRAVQRLAMHHVAERFGAERPYDLLVFVDLVHPTRNRIRDQRVAVGQGLHIAERRAVVVGDVGPHLRR